MNVPVVLVISLTQLALQACTDLSANTDTVSDFAERYLGTSLDDFSDDFVPNAKREFLSTPSASDGVEVAWTRGERETERLMSVGAYIGIKIGTHFRRHRKLQ